MTHNCDPSFIGTLECHLIFREDIHQQRQVFCNSFEYSYTKNVQKVFSNATVI